MDGERILAIPVSLIFEATAAYELTHDARGRYFFVADGQEKVYEFQQAMGLRVLRTVLGNAGKNNLCMGAQYGELDIEGRVEHDIKPVGKKGRAPGNELHSGRIYKA